MNIIDADAGKDERKNLNCTGKQSELSEENSMIRFETDRLILHNYTMDDVPVVSFLTPIK